MSQTENQISDTFESPSSSIAMLRKLEWRVRHAVASVLSGEYKSSFRGKGMEFDQVGKYEYGDDVRDIDWNVTARLGEPYRKKFVEEREVTLVLLFEDTPSLQFGSGERSKREALLELSSLLMLLSAVNGDRVSLLYASPTGYEFTKSSAGRGRVLHTAATLLGKPAPDALGPQRAVVPWKYLLRAAPRHSIFVWLSDFPALDKPEGWNVIKKRYQPVGFRIEDPWERALPNRGEQTVYDPVSGRLFNLNGRSLAQKAAHEKWNRDRDSHFKELFPVDSDRLTLQAGEDALDTVVKLFQKRALRFGRG